MFVVLLTPLVAHADEQEVALRSFASNIQSFPTYRVKYKLTQTSAASEADAIAGRWENSKSAVATLIVDGEFEKFECDAGPPPRPPAKGGTSFTSVPFVSSQYLAGPPGAAGYTSGLSAINLFAKESGKSGMVDATPLNMGVMGHRNTHGPDRLAADALAYTTAFRGREQVSGRAAVGVGITKKQTGEVFDFWLDPERGHLPLQIDVKLVSKRVWRTRLLSARLCPGDRWFPERVLSTVPKAAGGAAVTVNEILVLELDVDTKPRPEDFCFKAPAGTQVFIQDKPGGIRLKQDETICGNNLDDLFGIVERSSANPLIDTGLAPQPRRLSWWWACVAGGLILLIVGLVRYRRTRPAQK